MGLGATSTEGLALDDHLALGPCPSLLEGSDAGDTLRSKQRMAVPRLSWDGPGCRFYWGEGFIVVNRTGGSGSDPRHFIGPGSLMLLGEMTGISHPHLGGVGPRRRGSVGNTV